MLGDSHNFGRRVAVHGERVHKPRTLFWEWLVLGADSPLRRRLDEIAAADGPDPDAFGFLPRLGFRSPKAERGGDVERIELEPLRVRSPARRRELAQAVGRSLAFFGWFGVSDLHWENMVIGAGPDGRAVFAPLDIELVLADYSSPVETRLLPAADPDYAAVYRHSAGVRRALPYLGKPVAATELVALVAAYHELLACLERHSRTIAEVLAGERATGSAPIRVCLRGTADYVLGKPEALWPPLLDAELEQLARGDIPYFFRLFGRPGIHYYRNRSLGAWNSLPRTGDVPKLEPLLSLARGLRSPSRDRLREQGLFVLLSAFDHPGLSGTHAAGELEVRFGLRTLSVRRAGGELLSCPRNLRKIVGSVYLPCRCGEVRGVFVPPTTRCSGARRARARSRL
ncbi:MAG TPA: hypothetical protein VGK73_32030 [Polyangiaceae bacterium]